MFQQIIKIKKKIKSNKTIPQQVKDFILFGFTFELCLFALFYIYIIIFGGSGIAEISAANIQMAILLFVMNLITLPALLIIYLNHNYSMDEYSLKRRHKRGAAILLLNALFMPYYWYRFVFIRNKKLGLYRKK